MLSLIIPTKNRPSDLKYALNSIISQTYLPEEIIVVDQSNNDESKVLFKKCFVKYKTVKIHYIHDKTINGLVEAKSVGVKYATKDIICFIEDDVYLENDYIEQIIKGFELNPNMIGCSGIVTNPPKKNFLYNFIFNIFHLGMFNDKRISIFGKFNHSISTQFIKSDKLSGGISAWKKKVFSLVPFDLKNKFHMLEDIDFSSRVSKYFGERLYINTKMRLKHFSSPVNRNNLFDRHKNKIIEYFLFYKKNNSSLLDLINFCWLLIGMFLESFLQSIANKSFDPFFGYLIGFKDGYKRKVSY